jgi:hypothetical protein
MTNFSIDDYIPLIIIGSLLVLAIFILKICLAISKAEVRKGMKWVAISSLIQFGVIFFISSPMMLLGIFIWHGPPKPEVLIPTILISFFIDVNVMNIIHRIGIKKSVVIGIFLIAPITIALFFLGSSLADLISIH